ncbi:MAG: hypothetical protein AAF657_18895 [Acidobacteriota bacterium]
MHTIARRIFSSLLGLVGLVILLPVPSGAQIDVSGRTLPEPPPAVPDLNFNKDPAQRVLTRGKRSTVDGRVVVEASLQQVVFKPFVPEDLVDPSQPFTLGTGSLLAGGSRKKTVPFTAFHQSSMPVIQLASVALCDANASTLLGRRYLSSPAQNPVRCGPGLAHDCYDVSVVVALGKLNNAFELWSTPVRVEVERPKRPAAGGLSAAAIHSVTVTGVPVKSSVVISTPAYPGDFMETPTVSADGRVLVVNGGTGGLLYSVWSDPGIDDPGSLAVCDARGWSTFHRLSHAFFDPAMDPYGFGDYQLRDTKGRLVADGEPVRGSYPWLDRSANNVVFSHVQAVNPTPAEGGYTFSLPPESSSSCLDPGYVVDRTLTENDQAGLSTVGLWTRGKLVHLDGRANLSSYIISFNRLDKDIALDCTTTSCLPVVGSCANKTAAQAAAALVRSHGLMVEVWDDGTPIRQRINEARNTQIFSNESHFNEMPSMQPMTPRDVTWILNTSRNSMELAFDDVFAPNVLLDVSMAPTISWENDPGSIPYFDDGFLLDSARNVIDYVDPWVQNAATARLETGFPAGLKPADYGVLEGGARIEPIAAGGFEGRGVFLDGIDDRIRFALTSAGTGLADTIYLGLWLNPHDVSNGLVPVTREILHFPDGTILQLKGDDRIRIKKLGVPGADVLLLPGQIRLREDQWIHLGIQASWNDPAAAKTSLTLYVNGYRAWAGELARQVFRLQAGDILLGFDPTRPTTQGLKGWVDELHIAAATLSTAEACARANGILVAVDPNDPTHSDAISAQYPNVSHAAVAATVGAGHPPWTQFYCEIHYPEDDALFRASALPRPFFGGGETQVCIDDINRSGNDRCLSQQILFPEGPLFWNLPRPVSRTNAFCTSCHTDADIGRRATVDPDEVLVARPEWAIDDPRRQPTQPAPILFGHLPLLFHGHPNADPNAGEHPIDPLVLPED